MHRARLAARMAAADGDLARSARAVRRRSSIQAPTARVLRAGLPQLDRQPVAGAFRRRSARAPSARGGSPPRGRAARRRRDRPAPRRATRVDASRPRPRRAASAKVPSGCCISRLFGSCDGVRRHLVDVALGDEEVVAPVVVHIAELGVPAGRGAAVVADDRAAARRCRSRRAPSRKCRRGSLNCSSWSPIEVSITSGRPSPVMSRLAMPMPQSETCCQPSASARGRAAASSRHICS